MRYSKWIGYEFASNFETENFPTIKFPNGIYTWSVSGYLMDIEKNEKSNKHTYLVELRYKNNKYEYETQIIHFTCNDFKKTFYDATALPI